MTVDGSPRRTGGRDARRAARLQAHAARVPFLTRTLAPFEVLNEEGLATIEHNADTILQEVGLEFRGDPDALRLFRDAGADVDGERVRFPRGLAREIVQASAPREFIQYARNHDNDVRRCCQHSNDHDHDVGQWDSDHISARTDNRRAPSRDNRPDQLCTR